MRVGWTERRFSSVQQGEVFRPSGESSAAGKRVRLLLSRYQPLIRAKYLTTVVSITRAAVIKGDG